MEVVIGADVCKGSWVFVRLENGAFSRAWICNEFARGVQDAGDVARIGVDIPIGYPALPAQKREADGLARQMVGPRWRSVFITPHPGVRAIEDYEAANRKSRRLTGNGLSKQSYYMISKILEVEAIVMQEAHERIVEVHPEVSFRALAVLANGADQTLEPKNTWNGHKERLMLLAEAGIVIPHPLENARTAAPDDILDAAAAAWSAHRSAAGHAVPLPFPPQRTEPPRPGEQGRPVAIWY